MLEAARARRSCTPCSPPPESWLGRGADPGRHVLLGLTTCVIQLSDLTKTFGDRTLFDHVTWQIGDGERVGLCGPNGAGKTTLLKILGGIEESDSGAVVKPVGLSIGYLPQDGLTHAGRTVFEEASGAFQPLLDMKAEMHDIEHKLGDASVPQDEHDAM